MTEDRSAHLTPPERAALAQLGAALVDLITIANAVLDNLSTMVEDPVKPPFNAPQTREEAHAAHRRAHRRGNPAKIEADPELQAFILARIDKMTFAKIVSEVRATFPPERQCSLSGVGRWWQRRKAALASGQLNRL